MLTDIFDCRGLPFFTEGRLVNATFNFVVILKVESILPHTLKEFFTIYWVSRSELLRNGLEPHWTIGECCGVPINIIGNLSMMVSADNL